MNRKARRCCGIDVHKASLSACIQLHGKGRKVNEEIRTFGTTGDQLLALHDWPKEHEVTEVAMEATGVYWKPVYYVLEDGFRVILVNPAEIKRMPGRKTDVSDCAWLAQLLDHGMLRPSFIPPREIRENVNSDRTIALTVSANPAQTRVVGIDAEIESDLIEA